MHFNTVDGILTSYADKFDTSKYGKGIDGFNKYLNEDFQKDLEQSKESYDKYINSTNTEPKELLSTLKKDIEEDFKTNNIDIKLDSSFGKLDKNRQKAREQAVKDLKEACELRVWKLRAKKFLAPSITDRSASSLLNTFCPDDKEQAIEYYQIMEHKNDEIDPISGKTYGQLKLAYISKGIDKMKLIADQALRCKNRLDFEKTFTKDIYLFAGIFEIDGHKFDDFMKNLKFDQKYIDKNCPEFNDTIKYIQENKASLNTLGGVTQDISYITNPLYPYASDEDLALVGAFVENGIYDGSKFDCEKVGGAKTNPVESLSGTTCSYDFKKKVKYNGAEAEIEQFGFNLKLFVEPNTNTKAENMRFFNGDKEIAVDKNNWSKSMQDIGKLIINGEAITIKDNNGKFLFNYKSSIEHFLIPDIGEFSINSHKVYEEELSKELNKNPIKIGDYSKDVGVAVSNLKQDIKKEGERINEAVSGKIEKEIDDKLSKMKGLLDKVGPEKGRKKDESYFYDIKDMLGDVLGKKDKGGNDISFYKDKDAYIHGLKSIRTFCQAYLDEKTGTKMDKAEKAKYEAINNVYTSLYGVEQQLSEAKNFENNIEVNLDLKVRKDNPEFVKAVENKEIERPRLFEEMTKEEQKDYLKEKNIIKEDVQRVEIKEEGKEKALELEKEKEIGK